MEMNETILDVSNIRKEAFVAQKTVDGKSKSICASSGKICIKKALEI